MIYAVIFLGIWCFIQELRIMKVGEVLRNHKEMMVNMAKKLGWVDK